MRLSNQILKEEGIHLVRRKEVDWLLLQTEGEEKRVGKEKLC